MGYDRLRKVEFVYLAQPFPHSLLSTIILLDSVTVPV